MSAATQRLEFWIGSFDKSIKPDAEMVELFLLDVREAIEETKQLEGEIERLRAELSSRKEAEAT